MGGRERGEEMKSNTTKLIHMMLLKTVHGYKLVAMKVT